MEAASDVTMDRKPPAESETLDTTPPGFYDNLGVAQASDFIQSLPTAAELVNTVFFEAADQQDKEDDSRQGKEQESAKSDIFGNDDPWLF
jgi:hypothetical protein